MKEEIIILSSIQIVCSLTILILLIIRQIQINKQIKQNEKTAKRLEELSKELNFYSEKEN